MLRAVLGTPPSANYSPAKQAETTSPTTEEPENQPEIDMDISLLFRAAEEDLSSQPSTEKVENLIKKAEKINPSISEDLPHHSQPVVQKSTPSASISNNHITVGKELFVIPVNAAARSLDDLSKTFKSKKHISTYETFLCLTFKNWISLMVALLHYSLSSTEKKTFCQLYAKCVKESF